MKVPIERVDSTEIPMESSDIYSGNRREDVFLFVSVSLFRSP